MREPASAPILIRAAAGALGALALAVLAGWTFEIDALKSVLPGANSMKVNTALGFLLMAVALWFAASERTDKIAVLARLWAPILVAAIGALAIFEYAANINLGIDELLFRDDAPFGARGRMSAITAIAFMLFSGSFWIPGARTPFNNTAFLTVATAGLAISMLAAIGYLYQLPLLYRPLPVSAIAVHTAFGLVAAFAGVFAMRADIGWLGLFRAEGVAGVFGRQILPAVILVPLVLGWLALAIVRAHWVDGLTALALAALANMSILALVLSRAGQALGALETTLRRREHIYEAITNDALDAFMLADSDGRILDWNPQAERIFGWSRAEVIGRIVREVIMPPEAREAYAEGLKRYKAGGQYDNFGRRIEVQVVRRDDTRLQAELIAIPIKQGDDLFFALFCRDLTELKRAEEQLRQAQKMEAVGRLTGGIAHDFNNTLTAVITMLDSVLTRVPEALRPRIETALNAADRAAAMIKQLLAFSRKQVLTPSRLDLNDIVSRTSEVLRRTLGERIQISLLLGGGLPEALADAAQVESALLNLSINARDAMPEGGKLTIETALVELDQAYVAHNPDVTAGAYAMIAVSDTGAGMSAETLQRAFEPFFSTKDVDRGTGLGLSMVHGFAKQSGGHVKIYSELGLGTTVRLYLPLAYAGDAVAETDNGAARAEFGGSETVLLVEDNPLVRSSARAALRDLGYTVLEAANGHEALAVLRTGEPVDLLFTDIVMPEITGVELATEAARVHPSLRVLFTSGYTDSAIAQNGQLVPGAPFLSKPYRTRDLAARVREALDHPAATPV